MASDQDTIDRLTAENDQKNAQIAALSEQLKQAGGFRQEAIDGRARISELEAALASREQSLVTTIRDLSEARSAAASAQGQISGQDEKVAAALALADALKTLTR